MQVSRNTVEGRVEERHAVLAIRIERMRRQEDVEAFMDEVLAEVQGRELAVVALDFSRMKMFGSSFLGKLVMLRKKLKQTGVELRAFGMTPQVFEGFSTCKLQKLIPVFETEQAALG
jgi:anti-anti-sigma factor